MLSHSTIIFGLAALFASINAQQYVMTDLWQGETFFDNFYFFDDPDPNTGFVDYQSQASASMMGLISTTSTSAKFGVDSVNVYPEDAVGRPSVRIQSYKTFTEGLFVADIAHMPGDACGVWPGFWTLGSGTWPLNGEIDIIEGVNLNANNQYTLHSGDGACTITGQDATGTLLSNNCAATVNGQIVNTAGCSVEAATPNNYGDAFNGNGGGTYVMEWTKDSIRIWFFPRGQEPQTLNSPSPDVSEFGTPDANFAGCDIGSHFTDNSIVFSTDFCGDWAANQNVYQSQCPITVQDQPAWESCVAQVANNPSAYSEGYWEVNFIKIFADPASGGQPLSSSSSSCLPTTTSVSSSSLSSPSWSTVRWTNSTSSSSYPTSGSTGSYSNSSESGVYSTVVTTAYGSITTTITYCPKCTASKPTAQLSYTGNSTPTPNPQSQHTSPGYKGYPTTPQAVPPSSNPFAAQATAPSQAGNGYGKPTGTGTGGTQVGPLTVSTNDAGRKSGMIVTSLVGILVALIF